MTSQKSVIGKFLLKNIKFIINLYNTLRGCINVNNLIIWFHVYNIFVWYNEWFSSGFNFYVILIFLRMLLDIVINYCTYAPRLIWFKKISHSMNLICRYRKITAWSAIYNLNIFIHLAYQLSGFNSIDLIHHDIKKNKIKRMIFITCDKTLTIWEWCHIIFKSPVSHKESYNLF